MAFPLGIEPILKKGKESFFLAPLTYSYIYFVNQEITWYLVLTISTLALALLMYVEQEIRDDLGDKYVEVKPWLYGETLVVIFWIFSNIHIYYLYIWPLNWRNDATLAGLGLINMAYAFGWVVDKIYARKYSKHYEGIEDS